MQRGKHYSPRPAAIHRPVPRPRHTPLEVPMEQESDGIDWEREAEIMKWQLAEVPIERLNSELVTIFRLPSWYHETIKYVYEPKMVAIGPLHRHNENLKAMEEYKWRSLRNICGDVPVKFYIDKVRALEQRARDCYSEYVQMESPDFVKMLLLDACFIIDYFQKGRDGKADPICNVAWASIHLGSDLFLLENQIPFFVIHDLIALRDRSHNCQNPGPLLELFCKPLSRIFSTTELIIPNHISSCGEIHHLLQLYYQCMIPNSKENHIVQMDQPDMENGKSHSSWRHPFSWYKFDRGNGASIHDEGNNISCCTELHETGITFKKKQNPRNIFDITFKNGIMEMPFVKVEDIHNDIMWNMVALEQSQLHVYKSQILSSYLALMDSLINSEKDVNILERAGVVENYLQSDEDLAASFNQFTKSFVLDYSNHYYQKLFQEVRNYSSSTWHKHKARLKHDYFRNPWTTISVLAAGLLLLLTAFQTYYSYKSANNGNSQKA